MQTGFVERTMGSLAYTDYGGDGDLVLMLPGIGALRSEYRFLAPQLQAAGFHAVTADLRGHGGSSVPWAAYGVPGVGEDILAIIDHFGGNPAHVIGTSFAPGAAVWAAAERPEAVRSLVLISPFVRDVKMNPIMKAAFWLMLNNPWRVRAWRAYYGMMYPTRKPDDFADYLDALTANMAEPGRFAANQALASSPRQPSAERLGQVTAPTLVVMGTADPDFGDPVAEGEFVAQATGGTLALIEGAGHYPQTEMPEQTAPIILRFLRQVATPSESGDEFTVPISAAAR